MTKKNEFILVGLSFACLILFVALITVLAGKNMPAEEPANNFDNLCYWKTIHPGQGITENGPGEFEYTLIMTANGIDVYLPCNGTEK